MEKKELITHLHSINIKSFSKVQKEAFSEAIKIISNSNKKEDFLKAIDILLKLLGIGSNFFS